MVKLARTLMWVNRLTAPLTSLAAAILLILMALRVEMPYFREAAAAMCIGVLFAAGTAMTVEAARRSV